MSARSICTARSVVLAALTASSVAWPAMAAGPSVTIYSRDLGFVRESRRLEIPATGDTVRLEDVSNRLDFSSVRLAPAQGRVTRLAYRWDTSSGDQLLERSLGMRVRTVSRGDRIAEGTLLSADGAWVVLRADDGAVLSVSRNSLEEVRLAKPAATLSLRPAIEAVIQGARRGTIEAELSYLTGGLSWTAEHTLVRTGETTARWATAVQVVNTTGREYRDASVKLVAGDPSRTQGVSAPMERMKVAMQVSSMMASGEADMSEQSFGDYHLYTLGSQLTLRDRETQGLTMYDARDVSVKPRYLYRNGDPRGVLSRLDLVNATKGGPGAPLPAGRVRSFAADADGELQFTGETRIGHTAVDEKFEVELGYAFDIAAERRETGSRRISDREREYTVQIELRNRKQVAARVTVEEPATGEWELVKSSHPGQREDGQKVVFDLEVAAGKTLTLTYTARQRW